MKIKAVVALLVSTFFTGCASIPEKAVGDFFEGASANAKARDTKAPHSIYANKRDNSLEALDDTMAGILTAFLRDIFDSKDSDSN